MFHLVLQQCHQLRTNKKYFTILDNESLYELSVTYAFTGSYDLVLISVLQGVFCNMQDLLVWAVALWWTYVCKML